MISGKTKAILIVFLLAIGIFVILGYKTHLVFFLPYSLLIVCLLMHVFMHTAHSKRNK